jgi:hypothetical protein
VERDLLAKPLGHCTPAPGHATNTFTLVNYVCMFFFIGASNLRLEKEIDALLDQNRNIDSSARPV